MTRVNLNAGSMKFSDRIMHDSEKHGKYEVSMKEAFALSSNVGIAKLANDAYNKSMEGRMMFRNRLSQFGLDKVTDIEISGEPKPSIKNPTRDKKLWYGTTIPWMAHGYELSMTPLQLLTFYNAVANNGKMMKPYLVSEIRNEEKVIKSFEPKIIIESIARPENIAFAKEMMEEVVNKGTASAIKSTSVSMAGKTGTTRINYSNKEEYAKYNASFCGYFPAENPEYSLMIVIYEPKGAFYGASVAAPVFKAIAEQTMSKNLEINPVSKSDSTLYADVVVPERNTGYGMDFLKIFDYVGLQYKKNSNSKWVSVDPLQNTMIVSKKMIAKNVVPDVRGMGARDAMYVLENVGLSVSLYGKGKVIRQSLTPGLKANNQRIEVFLN
jgi:cell division protein FtsI (penicillin-binding protein 3)